VRQVVLDTETTGLNAAEHRIIEVGCVELCDRRYSARNFHRYINPEREVEEGAQAVHGIGNEFLVDKPRFAEVAEELREFISDAELIIHNAPFDVGFLDAEYRRLDAAHDSVEAWAEVCDTLVMARKRYPGQRNTLDALCKRLGVDNSERDLHGALLDARLLAEVWLALTGGQAALGLDGIGAGAEQAETGDLHAFSQRLPPVRVSDAEKKAHQARLAEIRERAGHCVWDTIAPHQSG